MVRPVVLGAKHGQHPAVARFAVEEAARQGVPLRVVHASEDVFVSRALFDDLAQHCIAEPDVVPVDHAVVAGSAIDVLLEEARHATAVVLGADDAPWVARAVGVEISQTVASRADAPVLVVPRTAIRGRSMSEVVAAVDVDADLEGQLGYAFDTAGRRHDGLHVVHVAGMTTDNVTRARRGQRLQDVVDRWRDHHPSTSVRITVESGNPVHTCLIASSRASVLVLGRPTREHHRLVSPSVVTRVLRRSSAPVAIVPPANDRHMGVVPARS